MRGEKEEHITTEYVTNPTVTEESNRTILTDDVLHIYETMQ